MIVEDYFFDLVGARGELAASRSILENLIRAIETELPITREILLDVSLKLAKEQIVVIETLLERKVGQ